MAIYLGQLGQQLPDARLGSGKPNITSKELPVATTALPPTVAALLHATNGDFGMPIPMSFLTKCTPDSPKQEEVHKTNATRLDNKHVTKVPEGVPPQEVVELQSITNTFGESLSSLALQSRLMAMHAALCSSSSNTDTTEMRDDSPPTAPVRRLVSAGPCAKATVAPPPGPRACARQEEEEAETEDNQHNFRIGVQEMLRYREIIKGADTGPRTTTALKTVPWAQVPWVQAQARTAQKQWPRMPASDGPRGTKLAPNQKELEEKLLRFLQGQQLQGGICATTSSFGVPSGDAPFDAPFSSSAERKINSDPPMSQKARQVWAELDALRKAISRQSPETVQGRPVQTGWSTQVAPQAEEVSDLSDWDSDAEEPASDPDEPAEIIVGPTKMASMPFNLEDLSLPQGSLKGGSVEAVPLKSSSRCLSLSDARRLSHARLEEAPLSFGSVVHLNHGPGHKCRPCMFERWAGRCSKSWLCDFCHLHEVQKVRQNGAGGPRAQGRRKALPKQRPL